MSPVTANDPLPKTTNQRLWLMMGIILLLIIVVSGVMFGSRLFGPTQLNGMVLQSNGPVPDFTLTTQTGLPGNLSDYRGQIVMLYFGYTYCPDVCPITLDVLDSAIAELPKRQHDDIQVIMVSVDPERDTPEVLAEYLAYFNPDFVGMTGSIEAVELAASPLGIYFAKREVESSAGYFVDHTASVAVIDKEGTLRLLYPFETPAESISADLKVLLRE